MGKRGDLMQKRLFIPQESIPALLDGTKTQHRVVIKPQPTHHYDDNCDKPGYFDTGGNNWACERCGGEIEPCTGKGMHLPFQPGDLIWVPEMFAHLGYANSFTYGVNDFYAYKIANKYEMEQLKSCGFETWYSPVTMPVSAARIWLEVLGVRVERLQSITEEDAKAEGVQLLSHDGMTIYTKDYREAFKILWDSINAKRGYGWETNCWVWVIEFRRLQKVAIDPWVIGDTKIQTDKGIRSGKRVDPSKEDAVLGLEVR